MSKAGGSEGSQLIKPKLDPAFRNKTGPSTTKYVIQEHNRAFYNKTCISGTEPVIPDQIIPEQGIPEQKKVILKHIHNTFQSRAPPLIRTLEMEQ